MPFLHTICSIIFFKTDCGSSYCHRVEVKQINFNDNHYLSLKTTIHAVKLENTPKCLFLIVNMY